MGVPPLLTLLDHRFCELRETWQGGDLHALAHDPSEIVRARTTTTQHGVVCGHHADFKPSSGAFRAPSVAAPLSRILHHRFREAAGGAPSLPSHLRGRGA